MVSVWDFFIMIGIYKITSPTKKIYIGQSINIEKRFFDYKKIKNCKSQTILNRSFLKHGTEIHKFEIICECEIHELNNKERYYQDLYSAIGKNGMNCRLTSSLDRSGKLSENTKKKLSDSKKGKKMSDDFKINKSINSKGNLNIMYDKKHTIYSKLKMSNSRNRNKEFIGVSWAKERNKYLSQIRVFGTSIKINLGRYNCHLKAHLVYLKALNNIELFNGNVKEFKSIINEY